MKAKTYRRNTDLKSGRRAELDSAELAAAEKIFAGRTGQSGVFPSLLLNLS